MAVVIGKRGSTSIGFDLPTLIETRLLVQANSGGGKSWAIRRLLEQSHGQVQQIVIDLEGEFSTLRPKFDYVIAGKGGDTAAHPSSAKLLAKKLMEMQVSAICDIYELKAHDRIRFVRLFLESLLSLPKKLYHPVLVVLDEAHQFCPQNGKSESASAVIDLSTRGRKRGLCAVLATQRLAKLHKDASAETLNKLIGRTGQDIDQVRAADELGIRNKDERLALRNIAPGAFRAFGPALRVAGKSEGGVVQVVVGPVKSVHPSVGSRQLDAPPAPTAAIRKVLGELSDLPEAAEKEARTMASLKKDLALVRRELTIAQKNPGAAEAEKRVQAMQELSQKCKYLELTAEVRLTALDLVAEDAAHILSVVAGGRQVLPGATKPEIEKGKQPAALTRSQVKQIGFVGIAVPPPAMPRLKPIPDFVTDTTVTRPQQKILDALLAYETLGLTTVHKNSLAALAGVSPKSGGYKNNLSSLRSSGLIDYPQSSYACLTEIGREFAQPSIQVDNLADVHQAWLNIVTAPRAKILQALIAAYPDDMSKLDLAPQIGVSSESGGYKNNLSGLRTLGAIDYPTPGRVRATDLLFPEGLV